MGLSWNKIMKEIRGEGGEGKWGSWGETVCEVQEREEEKVYSGQHF